MPYFYYFLTGNLIKENWERERLDKVVMLRGPLLDEAEDISNWKVGNTWYVWTIRDHITAFPAFDIEQYRMFFNINSDMELEGLSSGKIGTLKFI